MQELTQRQREVLEYVQAHIQLNGFAPTVREIMKGMGIGSSSTVQGHLSKLQDKGYIKRVPNSPRAIIVLEELDNKVKILKQRKGVPTVIEWRERRFIYEPKDKYS